MVVNVELWTDSEDLQCGEVTKAKVEVRLSPNSPSLFNTGHPRPHDAYGCGGGPITAGDVVQAMRREFGRFGRLCTEDECGPDLSVVSGVADVAPTR